jgi:hypothetical protein
MRFLRQEDQQPPGDADLGGQARALGADGILDDLRQNRLAFEQNLLDRLGRIAVVAVFPNVGDMQKGRTLQANVDEGGLHSRQHPLDLAQIDVADQPALTGPLDVQFLHHAELHHGGARFLRSDVDQNVVIHGMEIPKHCSNSAVSHSGRPTTPE